MGHKQKQNPWKKTILDFNNRIFSLFSSQRNKKRKILNQKRANKVKKTLSLD